MCEYAFKKTAQWKKATVLNGSREVFSLETKHSQTIWHSLIKSLIRNNILKIIVE